MGEVALTSSSALLPALILDDLVQWQPEFLKIAQ